MIPTDIYIRLDYRSYKRLEEQLRNFKDCETVHTTVTGYYHKALRLEVGDVVFEFQGPAVKEPVVETFAGRRDSQSHAQGSGGQQVPTPMEQR